MVVVARHEATIAVAANCLIYDESAAAFIVRGSTPAGLSNDGYTEIAAAGVRFKF